MPGIRSCCRRTTMRRAEASGLSKLLIRARRLALLAAVNSSRGAIRTDDSILPFTPFPASRTSGRSSGGSKIKQQPQQRQQ